MATAIELKMEEMVNTMYEVYTEQNDGESFADFMACELDSCAPFCAEFSECGFTSLEQFLEIAGAVLGINC